MKSTMQVGETSEIYMPRSARPQHFYEPATASRGRLDTLTFISEKIQVGRRTWGGERRIQVYLPPDYDATTKRYPAIYVNDGDNAVAIGKMKNTLDRLYMDWGAYDYRYASYEYDTRGFSQRFVELLRNKKYQVEGGAINEGSDYASWRRRTDKILQTFFPKPSPVSN